MARLNGLETRCVFERVRRRTRDKQRTGEVTLVLFPRDPDGCEVLWRAAAQDLSHVYRQGCRICE